MTAVGGYSWEVRCSDLGSTCNGASCIGRICKRQTLDGVGVRPVLCVAFAVGVEVGVGYGSFKIGRATGRERLARGEGVNAVGSDGRRRRRYSRGSSCTG